jgi:endoglucanase
MDLRATFEQWLRELTNLPTASGYEDAVVDWVESCVSERPDLELDIDSGGNVFVTQRRPKTQAPVLAVAHMDHPAFVITSIEGDVIGYEFRGGVGPAYFADAIVDFGKSSARVVDHDPVSGTGSAVLLSAAVLEPGDLGMWHFEEREVGDGRFAAPACDDLAGVAACLAALERARSMPDLGHYGVLLTRAEEVGLVGALHAAITGSVPGDARLLSVETSRELPDARVGDGPIVRVGDALTVFDQDMTNLISRAARESGISHQRKLMSGGACEASAFGGLGYRASGLCVALGNWHNRGNLTAVEAGNGDATPMTEEIDLEDFHGLIELILVAVGSLDGSDPTETKMRDRYQEGRKYLGRGSVGA